MKTRISEVQVVPIKPVNGLVGFASVVFDNSFYLSSIGIYTRPRGGYRLTYPTRKGPTGSLNVFYPINKSVADRVEQAVTVKFEEIVSR